MPQSTREGAASAKLGNCLNWKYLNSEGVSILMGTIVRTRKVSWCQCVASTYTLLIVSDECGH